MTRLPEIDPDYFKSTLEALLSIPSPSGYTDEIARWTMEEIQKMGIETELTRRGAIRARIPGTAAQPVRGVIAHLDTLGAIVRQLKDNGRLAVAPIGHWSSRFAEGARGTLFSEMGTFRGTILPLKASGHVFADEVDTQPVSWKQVEFRIDMPIYSKDDAERAHLAVGDIIAIDPQPEFFDNGYIVSRHLDDKAGVAALLTAMKALKESGQTPAVDTLFLFSITEEIGSGASSILTHDIASMVAIDNGAVAQGQGSKETGVTIAMGDMTGPFDFHLTRKLIELCREHDIRHQRDHFEHYRSDNASAVEGGADVRTALITFGIDASHGYERTHMDAPCSVAELVVAYVLSPVTIARDAEELGGLKGFPEQPHEAARGSTGHRTD
jgi:peptidase M42 family hydrolase